MATSYNIYESTDGGDTYSYFDSVTSDNPGTDAPATTYTATGLTTGTTPLFEVTAANSSGESSPTTPTGVAVPTGVTSVTATPSGDGSSATVTWTTDTSALGYVIFRTPDDGSTGPVLIDTITDSSTASYTDDTVTDTDSYTYEVDPYYTNPPPTTPGGNGTGPNASADDYTGNISGFSATLTGTTVNFTWSYQGSASFELEEVDQSDPGTNYFFVQAPGGRSATVSGLNPGDNYSFRLRADRADGTASGYATSGQIDVPATPTPQPTGPIPPTVAGDPDANLSLQAPTLSDVAETGSEPGDWVGTVDVTAQAPTNGDPIDDGGDYDLSFPVLSRDKDPFGLEIDGGAADLNGTGLSPWPENGAPEDGSQTTHEIEFTGTTGATYTYGAQVADFYGAYSAPSAPQSITLQGTLPPALSLKISPTDPSTVTWDQPDGVVEGTVSFYYITRVNGKDAATLLAHNIDLHDGTDTFSSLPDGTDEIFAIYDGDDGNHGEDELINGWSPYSNNVQVTAGSPKAPAAIAAGELPAGSSDPQVSVGWQNSSNNETGFTLQQSIDGGPFSDVQSTQQDGTAAQVAVPTSQLEASAAAPTLAYQAIAKGPSTNSTPSPVATVAFSRGGCDLTNNLLLVRAAVMYKLGHLSWFERYGMGIEATETWLAPNYWDILSMKEGGVAGPGTYVPGTCTVDGKVYDEYAVNYWLAGVMYNFLPLNVKLLYRAELWAYTSAKSDDGAEKRAWFEAGVAGDLNNVPVPAKYKNFIPGTKYGGHLRWEIGSVTGGESPYDD